jgi:hypothetical protein
MASTPMYPEGRTSFFTKWSNGILKFYKRSTGVEFFAVNGNTGAAFGTGVVKHLRTRVLAADVDAGLTLLPAVAGYKYRLIDCKAIAVGGAAGAVTTVDILGTLSGSTRKLVAYAQANLTQSTVLRDGATGGAVLADGASYTQNDVNTAITIFNTGNNVTTATHIDVELTYALEV